MASGGDRRGAWPAQSKIFLEEFLPLQNPPNYQLVADELDRLCAVVRARSSVEAHVTAHYAHLVPAPPRKSIEGHPAPHSCPFYPVIPV
jgi:hypothetical protein